MVQGDHAHDSLFDDASMNAMHVIKARGGAARTRSSVSAMNESVLRDIEAAYLRTRDKALAEWATYPSSGERIPLPYDEAALAWTVGSLFEPPPILRPLLDELDALARCDRSVVPVPRDALHFTFLAVTPHRWHDLAAMPDAGEVRACVRKHLESLAFEVRSVRLVPTVGALLLAGVPSDSTLAARDRFIADVVGSNAQPWLRERYGDSFPPLFWHTTLVRVRSERCPAPLRAFYRSHEDVRIERLRLVPPRLHAASFDWSRRHRIG